MSTRKLALKMTRVTGVILFGTLLIASLLGVNVAAMLGLGSSASHPGRLIMVMEGLVVTAVIGAGSLFTAGVIALLTDREEENKEGTKTEQA